LADQLRVGKNRLEAICVLNPSPDSKAAVTARNRTGNDPNDRLRRSAGYEPWPSSSSVRHPADLDSGIFLPEVCIDYACDVLSEPLLDGENLGQG